jgi:hypothetical protein
VFLQKKTEKLHKKFSSALIDGNRFLSQTLGAMWRIYSIGSVVEVGLFQERCEEVMFGNGAAHPKTCVRSLREEVMQNLTTCKRHHVDAIGAVQLASKGVRK